MARLEREHFHNRSLVLSLPFKISPKKDVCGVETVQIYLTLQSVLQVFDFSFIFQKKKMLRFL